MYCHWGKVNTKVKRQHQQMRKCMMACFLVCVPLTSKVFTVTFTFIGLRPILGTCHRCKCVLCTFTQMEVFTFTGGQGPRGQVRPTGTTAAASGPRLRAAIAGEGRRTFSNVCFSIRMSGKARYFLDLPPHGRPRGCARGHRGYLYLTSIPL